MSKFNGFLDNLASGALSPKGNMADWQHASRLYVSDTQKHAPKVSFLYHVTFYLTDQAKSTLKDIDKYTHEIGMLVKRADLPKFQAQTEVKNKYNRKKNVQTRLDYQPVSMSFHDDNFGATSALLEAYFKYYYGDGKHTINSGAYGNRSNGDTTYQGNIANSKKYGMDNSTPNVPFFHKIEIAQLARKSYTKFTLVNPIITDWAHDTLENGQSSPLENQITIAYDTVLYDRGYVEAGENGDPTGFGRTDHYDVTPSPITPLGGSALSLDAKINAGIDLYEYITQGENFDNPIQAGIAAANLVNSIRDNGIEGLRESGLRLVTDAIGSAAGIDVSGVANTVFPKSNGNGGAKDLLIATTAVAGLSIVSDFVQTSTTTGDRNPQQEDDARFQSFHRQYQSDGRAGGVDEARSAWNALPASVRANY